MNINFGDIVHVMVEDKCYGAGRAGRSGYNLSGGILGQCDQIEVHFGDRREIFAACWCEKVRDGYLDALREQSHEIQQVLGKALGYPMFKDDQKNFPGADDGDGVCVFEHIAETIAAEAASRIVALEAVLHKLVTALPESATDEFFLPLLKEIKKILRKEAT